MKNDYVSGCFIIIALVIFMFLCIISLNKVSVCSDSTLECTAIEIQK